MIDAPSHEKLVIPIKWPRPALLSTAIVLAFHLCFQVLATVIEVWKSELSGTKRLFLPFHFFISDDFFALHFYVGKQA